MKEERSYQWLHKRSKSKSSAKEEMERDLQERIRSYGSIYLIKRGEELVTNLKPSSSTTRKDTSSQSPCPLVT